jgi:hypothetical protein
MAIKKSSGSGIPFGNTAGRPANPGLGQLYSNGEASRLELYTQSSGWQNIIQEVPGVASITGNYSEATNSGTITIVGTNFATGAIASAIGTNGVEVQAQSTTYNSLVQLTAVFTGLSNANEPYDIKVTNPSNLFGLIPDALYVNASPIWVTSSGSLGTFTEQVSITLSALSSTDSDSTVTYALASGSSLPSGVTLNSSTGVISGTLPDIASNTTYTFTINASDGVNTIPRTFSITSNTFLAISTAETLVVAGGGGGGSNGNTTGGGGGGAGGYLYNASTSFVPGTAYTLTIGTGGTGLTRTGGHTTPTTGNKGTNSIISGSGFTTITALGGGGGVSNQSGGTSSNASGGSGGGGNYIISPGTGVSGQGNAGGSSENAGGNNLSFGGGGGGGSAGTPSTPAQGFGGNGGAGTANSITGTSLFYAAGGGGGVRSNYTAGIGGSGIGGNGTVGTGNGSNASPANRGSGGGGGGGDNDQPSYIGGTGSDGVIIIAYPDNVVAPTISGGLTYDQPTRAGYRVYRFTAGTGTITF